MAKSVCAMVASRIQISAHKELEPEHLSTQLGCALNIFLPQLRYTRCVNSDTTKPQFSAERLDANLGGGGIKPWR